MQQVLNYFYFCLLQGIPTYEEYLDYIEAMQAQLGVSEKYILTWAKTTRSYFQFIGKNFSVITFCVKSHTTTMQNIL